MAAKYHSISTGGPCFQIELFRTTDAIFDNHSSVIIEITLFLAEMVDKSSRLILTCLSLLAMFQASAISISVNYGSPKILSGMVIYQQAEPS